MTDIKIEMTDHSANIKQIMEYEDDLMRNINAYNNAYKNYLLCYEPDTNFYTGVTRPPSANCNYSFGANAWASTRAITIADSGLNKDNTAFTTGKFDKNGDLLTSTYVPLVSGTNTASQIANADRPASYFLGQITSIPGQINTLATGIHVSSGARINGNIQTETQILETHNQIKQKRANLDLEIQKLYNIQDSYASYAGQNVDATIYAGVIWTILATSAVYYVFTKL